MKQTILMAIAAACAVCLLANFGVTQALGAHPWWAEKVAYIGAGAGILLAIGMSYFGKWALPAAIGDLTVSAIITWQGKRMFAASSGDSALGGVMWYYGWIAVCAFTVVVVAFLLRRRAV